MRLTLIFVSLIISFLLGSCEKEASSGNILDFHKKIDIIAFISPDLNENKIFVSSSIPRFGETKIFEPIGNLRLRLFENSKEIQPDTTLEFIEYSGYYFHIQNFRFKDGYTYNIKVTSDLGLEAEADCRIPTKRNYKINVDTSHVNITGLYGDKYPAIIVKPYIEDYPGENNYYRVLYQWHSYKNGKERWHDNINQGDLVFNDEGKNGKKMLLRPVEIRKQLLEMNSPDSSLLSIYLLNTDLSYYNFHKSVENYHFGEEPFTEPSFLYSNVRGGVGIFASYVVDSIIFRLK